MQVNWNLTRHLKKYRQADAIVISVGKSGRTWLRVMISKYLAEKYGVQFRINDLHALNPAIPRIAYSHELWSHIRVANWHQRLCGKFIIPDAVLRNKKLVVLYRDPRDTIVSLYFQATRRSRRKVTCDISTFIRHPKYGIHNVINVMSAWHRRFRDYPNYVWVRYETLRQDTAGELARVLAFIDPPVDLNAVTAAVEFSDFERMKKMERQNEFGTAILSATNTCDQSSYKVREGKIGGYSKHFDQADLDYIETQMQQLDSWFGY